MTVSGAVYTASNFWMIEFVSMPLARPEKLIGWLDALAVLVPLVVVGVVVAVLAVVPDDEMGVLMGSSSLG